MRDANDAIDATPACRKCGTRLLNREYNCPECDTPHFPHLLPAVAAPMFRMTTFFAVLAGPVLLYTLYLAIIDFAARV